MLPLHLLHKESPYHFVGMLCTIQATYELRHNNTSGMQTTE